MITLKDVAKLACVDVSTVSRALNNVSYVHPETKVRILKAVKKLGYQPNVLAQGLRQGHRHTIGIVVPGIQMTLFAEMIQGIEYESNKLGYESLICNTEDNPIKERECLIKLRSGFVNGIIIASTGRNTRLIKDIKASGISIVQIVRVQDENVSSVAGNYEACGYDAVNFLAQKGCKKIGLINGNNNLAPYRKRYIGYKNAIIENGLEEIVVSYEGRGNTFEYGYKCTDELLEIEPHLDAIMVAVDIQGLGAFRTLKERGLSIPKDIKVLSLTGHSIGRMLETTMTAMELPAMEMGRNASRMLIAEIETSAEEKNIPQHLLFNAKLEEREST